MVYIENIACFSAGVGYSYLGIFHQFRNGWVHLHIA